MNKQQYKQFLGELASGVRALVAENQSCAEDWFRDNCDRFWKKQTAYEEARNKAVRAAEANPKLRDYNDGVPPKKGWEWTHYRWKTGILFKGFWSKPLPFRPDEWVSRYYGEEASPIHRYDNAQEPTQEPTKEEKIMCDFVVLGLIHDESLQVTKSDRLCSINDETFRFHTWEDLQLSNDVAYEHGDRIKGRLEKALDSVKADLAGKKPTEKEQGATPAKKEEKGSVNVNIFGDVQAGNLQIAQDASIHEQSVIKEKKKGILRKTPRWIYYILGTLAALLTILHLLGWLEPIRRLFTR
jgi:hypothetical protein